MDKKVMIVGAGFSQNWGELLRHIMKDEVEYKIETVPFDLPRDVKLDDPAFFKAFKDKFMPRDFEWSTAYLASSRKKRPMPKRKRVLLKIMKKQS